MGAYGKSTVKQRLCNRCRWRLMCNRYSRDCECTSDINRHLFEYGDKRKENKYEDRN